MKKFIKIFAVLLCLALALTVFAACGKEEKKEDDGTTKASTTEATTVETTTEAPKGDATHDGRLIGVWNGTMAYPMDEDGATMNVYCTVEFKEDGTFSVSMTEEQMKAMMIETYLYMFECETEEELDAYLQANTGMSLDEVIEDSLTEAEALDETGTWETEDNKKLYEMSEDETKDDVVAEDYTVSEDGKTVVITMEDEDMGTVTLTLTKA